jgi:Ca-activated chloride channel family protein
MSFLWPAMLVSLLIVPLFAALYAARVRQRQHAAARYGSLGVLQTTGGAPLTWQRHLPVGLFLAGLAVLLVALARPQATVSLPRIEGTVLLAFDVSGSMAATDVEPTRMEVAKTAAREFVERQPESVRIGVIVFSDAGFAVQAPSSDREQILAAIARLNPERGTSLGSGILAALQVLETDAAEAAEEGDPAAPPAATPTPYPPGVYSSAMIVLLTDGENTSPPDPLAAAQAALERGVRIYPVGVGSPGGAQLELEGFSVHTQLDEPMLRLIAQITGGTYHSAQNEADLRAIYEEINPQLVVKPEAMEVTSLLAAASLLIWLMGGALSLAWFGRLP